MKTITLSAQEIETLKIGLALLERSENQISLHVRNAASRKRRRQRVEAIHNLVSLLS